MQVARFVERLVKGAQTQAEAVEELAQRRGIDPRVDGGPRPCDAGLICVALSG